MHSNESACRKNVRLGLEQVIENMIKLRALGEDWDNVIPRALPDVGSRRGGGDAPEVSQEKSKLGLGELHEREYLNKATRLDIEAEEK